MLNSASPLTGILWGDYWAGGTTIIRNADVRGCYAGFGNTTSIHGTLTVEDSYFYCYFRCISITTPNTPGTGATLENHVINIDNCTLDQWGANGSFYKLAMDYSAAHDKTNLRVTDEVNVTDYDGTSGDNFRLYYVEQDPDFEMPITNGTVLIACPEAGLTNAQAYVKYHQDGTLKVPEGALSDPEGCAIGGAVAPGDATQPVTHVPGPDLACAWLANASWQ